MEIKSSFTEETYVQAVHRALKYIKKGDIYQVNLSQQFVWDGTGYPGKIDALELYKSLRRLSPSHFGGYFDCGDFQIISSSPERFLSLDNRIVETRPMKGTRARGKTPKEDDELREDLLLSPKERAELLMITDLERNDLGRVCEYGSIHVKAERTLEQYETVFQTTATIEGRLREDKDCFDLLEACFPGGSVTGCPKIRAMEIIEELEPARRGIYTGAMGYVSFSGRMDFNVLIRTLWVRQKKVYFYAGGGIVSDSIAQDEYEEILVKAKAMRRCLEQCVGWWGKK